MKAKLIVEGKEFPIEILDPNLQELIIPNQPTKEKAKEVLQKCGILDKNGQIVDVYKDIFVSKVVEKKKTGYERATKEDGTYYFDNGGGYVGDSFDPYPETDGNNGYKAANYYTSKTVAENNIRADKLMRQLRRFAVEHREYNVDAHTEWYEINYNIYTKSMEIDTVHSYKYFGIIRFDTEETAQLAIDTFHDELIWYFTEYKDSL